MRNIAIVLVVLASSAVAHAQEDSGLDAPGIPPAPVRPTLPEAGPLVVPYVGFGLGGYAHLHTQFADPMIGASVMAGLQISPWFRVELQVEAGVRPLYYSEAPGSRRALAVPFASIKAPLMGGLYASDEWQLFLGTYPSVGLTSQWNSAAGSMVPTNVHANESVGWGNFLAAIVRVASNLELWVRAEGQVVFSLGWGTHIVASLSTALAIR